MNNGTGESGSAALLCSVNCTRIVDTLESPTHPAGNWECCKCKLLYTSTCKRLVVESRTAPATVGCGGGRGGCTRGSSRGWLEYSLVEACEAAPLGDGMSAKARARSDVRTVGKCGGRRRMCCCSMGPARAHAYLCSLKRSHSYYHRPSRTLDWYCLENQTLATARLSAL